MKAFQRGKIAHLYDNICVNHLTKDFMRWEKVKDW